MIVAEKFDGEKFSDGRIPKPRKKIEVQKQFFATDQDPETMRRDVKNLNRRNDVSNVGGFHLVVPQ